MPSSRPPQQDDAQALAGVHARPDDGEAPIVGRREVLEWSLGALFLSAFAAPDDADAQASGTEGDRLRNMTSTVVDGRVRSSAWTGRDGVLVGRAVGLVDAQFDRVMQTVSRAAGYDRILPTVDRVGVLERQHGNRLLRIEGHAPLRGSYQLLARMHLSGSNDGTHTISLRSTAADDPTRVRFVLTRTPGRVRSIVQATISIATGSVPQRRAVRIHREAAAQLIYNLRRAVAQSRPRPPVHGG